MRKLDDTGKLHARKRARAVWRREVGAVPQQWGNSSASYPTSRPAFTSSAGWPIGTSRRLKVGKISSPLMIRRLETTITKNILPTRNEKMGGNLRRKFWAGS